MKISFELRPRSILRRGLSILFLWAAISKIANPVEFHAALLAYQLPLPRSLLDLAAVLVPWIELLCGTLLLFNLWTESALACCFVLMLVFLGATGQAWLRGLDIACGCFQLNAFGIHLSAAAESFLESARFAFFRNLGLTAAFGWLLKEHLAALRRDFGALTRNAPVHG